MIHLEQEEKGHGGVACIKVVGVGGAGGNTINCMVESGFKGAEFYAVNTDAQALQVSLAGTKIQIGVKSTKGLGAGANPEIGKRAAEEDLDKVMQALSDADIVFVTGGMGGGTGSGAIPVIVQALKEKGILTIVVLTKPFLFEGKRRARITEQALETIKSTADTLLIIPNQKLLEVTDEQVSMIDAFGMINDVLNQSVRSISDIITRSGHINVDFADVREIMKDKGIAVMGTARASGQGRAKKAALEAISSPLLENMSIAGARSVLLNITGGTDLGLQEISEAASVIYEQADEDANIILGSVIDSQMGNEVAVTIIATGFPADRGVKAAQVQQEAPVQKIVAPSVPLQAVRQEEPIQKVQVQPVEIPLEIPQRQPMVEKVIESVQETVVQIQAAPVVEVKKEETVRVETISVKESDVIILAPQVEVASKKEEASPLIEKREQLSCPVRPMTEEEEFEQLLREEAELIARKTALIKGVAERAQDAVAVASEQKAETIVAAHEEKESSLSQAAAAPQAAAIDINDLDIPAFMRKNAKERRAE